MFNKQNFCENPENDYFGIKLIKNEKKEEIQKNQKK